MPSSQPAPPSSLQEYLKFLRGAQSTCRQEVPIATLASDKGLNVTTLYKAESGDQVRWDTIERGYGDLCRDDEEYARMLALWAVSQSKRAVSMPTLQRAMTKVTDQEERTMDRYAEQMKDVLGKLTPPERNLLLGFSEAFAGSAPTRAMAKAWLEATS